MSRSKEDAQNQIDFLRNTLSRDQYHRSALGNAVRYNLLLNSYDELMAEDAERTLTPEELAQRLYEVEGELGEEYNNNLPKEFSRLNSKDSVSASDEQNIGNRIYNTRLGRTIGNELTSRSSQYSDFNSDFNRGATGAFRAFTSGFVQGDEDAFGSRVLYDNVFGDYEDGSISLQEKNKRRIYDPTDDIRTAQEKTLDDITNKAIYDQTDIIDRVDVEYSRFHGQSLVDQYSLTGGGLQSARRVVRTVANVGSAYQRQVQLRGDNHPETVMNEMTERLQSQQEVLESGELKTALTDIRNNLGNRSPAYENDTGGYVNKAGVAEFIDLMNTAENKISISTFQFQNETISAGLADVMRRRVLEKLADGGSSEPLKIDLVLGYPRQRNNAERQDDDNRYGIGSTNYAILGPNLLEALKLEQIKEELKDTLKSYGVSDDELDNYVQLNIQFRDKKFHPKVYLTDNVAGIGTQNLTGPVGNSINQAGSNFETMRFVANKYDDKELINQREHFTELGFDQLRENKDAAMKNDSITQSLLYRQIKHAAEYEMEYGGAQGKLDRKGGGTATPILNERRGHQVGFAGDIYQHMKNTIDFAYENSVGVIKGSVDSNASQNVVGQSNTHMFMILDQAFMLQYGDTTFAKQQIGEMGAEVGSRFEDTGDENSAISQYREQQSKLFDMLIAGNASVIVDSHNFQKSVRDPIMNKVEDYATSKGGDDFLKKNLERNGKSLGLIAGFALFDPSRAKTPEDFDKSMQAMYSLLRAQGFTQERGFSERDLKQIVAMASGNIEMAKAPRQHTKSYGVMQYDDQGKGNLISYYMGSSNLGLYSLGIPTGPGGAYKPTDGDLTNTEMGIMLGAREVSDSLSRASAHQARTAGYLSETADGISINNPATEQKEDWSLNQEEERYELMLAQRHLVQTWNQLGNGSIHNPNFKHEIRTTPLWQENVNTGDLLILKNRLETMAKRLGVDSSAFQISERVGDTSASGITSINVTLNMNVVLGTKGFMDASANLPKLNFELTVLQGPNRGEGLLNDRTDNGDVPGFVYFVDKNQVVGNGIFSNDSGSTISVLGRREYEDRFESGLDEGRVEVGTGESVHMSSLDIVPQLFSTLIGEASKRFGTLNSVATYNNLNVDQKKELLFNYVSTILTGRGDYLDTTVEEDDYFRDNADIDTINQRRAQQKTNIVKARDTLSNNLNATNLQYVLQNIANDAYSSERRSDSELVAPLSSVDSDNTAIGLVRRRESLHKSIHGGKTKEFEGGFISKVNRVFSKVGEEYSSETATNMLIEELAVLAQDSPQLINVIMQSVYNDPLQKKKLQDFKKYQTQLFGAFLQSRDERTYGGQQGFYRTLLMGLGDSNVDKNTASLLVDTDLQEDGLHQLSQFARFLPLAYRPTTNVHEYLYRSVASKSSSMTKGDPDLDSWMFEQEARDLGDAANLRIISSIGIGTINKRSQYLDQVDGHTQVSSAMNAMFERMKAAGADDDVIEQAKLAYIKSLEGGAFAEGRQQSLGFYTGGAKKLAQLPQRIKNAIGARPFYMFSVEAQAAMEEGNSISGMVDNYMQKYRSPIQEKARIKGIALAAELEELTKLHGEQHEDVVAKVRQIEELNAAVEATMNSKLAGLGTVFTGRIKSVLNSEQVNYIQKVRDRLQATLGELTTEEELEELVRVEVLKAGFVNKGLGKMVAGSNHMNYSMALVQLTGTYTDTFLANPLYGSVYNDRQAYNSIRDDDADIYKMSVEEQRARGVQNTGMREGYFETQQKSVKGSMMGPGGMEILLQKDDVIVEDPTTGDFVHKRKVDGEWTTVNVVDKNRNLGSIRNVVDNTGHSALTSPTLGTQPTTSYGRRGENSVDYIYDVGERGGNFANNEYLLNFSRLRSIQAGSGRRVEGTDSSALIKGVANFAGRNEYRMNQDGVGVTREMNLFEHLEHQLMSSYRAGVADDSNSNIGVGGSLKAYLDYAEQTQQVKLQNGDTAYSPLSSSIHGLYNANNFKSFFWSHGATILRSTVNEQGGKQHFMLNELFNSGDNLAVSNAQKLAGALVVNFGTDFLTKTSEIGEGDTRALKQTLVDSMIEGKYGSFYQKLVLTQMQQASLELSRLGSADSDTVNYKGRTMSKAEALTEITMKKMTGQAGFSDVQLGGLRGITSSQLQAVMSGDVDASKQLLNQLRGSVIDPVASQAAGFGGINFNDPLSRQAALITTAVDLMHQLSKSGSRLQVPGEMDFDSRKVQDVLLNVSGRRDFSDEDDQMREDLLQAIEGLSTNVSAISIFTDITFSFSKDPTGTQSVGRHEAQHLITPFTGGIKQYQEGGQLESIQHTVAGLEALVADTKSGLVYYDKMAKSSFGNRRALDLASTEADLFFTSFYKEKFLGFYQSGTTGIDADDYVQAYKNINKNLLDGKYDWAASSYINASEDAIKSVEAFVDSFFKGLPSERRQSKIESYLLMGGDMFAMEAQSEITNKLIHINQAYQADPRKTVGRDTTKQFLSNMQNDQMFFSIPKVQVGNQFGQTVSFISTSERIHTILPSAQQMRVLGAEYADFVDPILGYYKTLSSIFVEGTIQNKVFEKVRDAAQVNQSIILSTEEAQVLNEITNAATMMPFEIQGAIGGARTQEAFAGKNKYQGFTSTAIGNLMVPFGSAVLAQTKLDEAGMRDNSERVDLIRRSSEMNRQRATEVAKQHSPLEKLMLDLDSVFGDNGVLGNTIKRTSSFQTQIKTEGNRNLGTLRDSLNSLSKLRKEGFAGSRHGVSTKAQVSNIVDTLNKLNLVYDQLETIKSTGLETSVSIEEIGKMQAELSTIKDHVETFAAKNYNLQKVQVVDALGDDLFRFDPNDPRYALAKPKGAPQTKASVHSIWDRQRNRIVNPGSVSGKDMIPIVHIHHVIQDGYTYKDADGETQVAQKAVFTAKYARSDAKDYNQIIPGVLPDIASSNPFEYGIEIKEELGSHRTKSQVMQELSLLKGLPLYRNTSQTKAASEGIQLTNQYGPFLTSDYSDKTIYDPWLDSELGKPDAPILKKRRKSNNFERPILKSNKGADVSRDSRNPQAWEIIQSQQREVVAQVRAKILGADSIDSLSQMADMLEDRLDTNKVILREGWQSILDNEVPKVYDRLSNDIWLNTEIDEVFPKNYFLPDEPIQVPEPQKLLPPVREVDANNPLYSSLVRSVFETALESDFLSFDDLSVKDALSLFNKSRTYQRLDFLNASLAKRDKSIKPKEGITDLVNNFKLNEQQRNLTGHALSGAIHSAIAKRVYKEVLKPLGINPLRKSGKASGSNLSLELDADSGESVYKGEFAFKLTDKELESKEDTRTIYTDPESGYTLQPKKEYVDVFTKLNRFIDAVDLTSGIDTAKDLEPYIYEEKGKYYKVAEAEIGVRRQLGFLDARNREKRFIFYDALVNNDASELTGSLLQKYRRFLSQNTPEYVNYVRTILAEQNGNYDFDTGEFINSKTERYPSFVKNLKSRLPSLSQTNIKKRYVNYDTLNAEGWDRQYYEDVIRDFGYNVVSDVNRPAKDNKITKGFINPTSRVMAYNQAADEIFGTLNRNETYSHEIVHILQEVVDLPVFGLRQSQHKLDPESHSSGKFYGINVMEWQAHSIGDYVDNLNQGGNFEGVRWFEKFMHYVVDEDFEGLSKYAKDSGFITMSEIDSEYRSFIDTDYEDTILSPIPKNRRNLGLRRQPGEDGEIRNVSNFPEDSLSTLRARTISFLDQETTASEIKRTSKELTKLRKTFQGKSKTAKAGRKEIDSLLQITDYVRLRSKSNKTEAEVAKQSKLESQLLSQYDQLKPVVSEDKSILRSEWNDSISVSKYAMDMFKFPDLINLDMGYLDYDSASPEMQELLKLKNYLQNTPNQENILAKVQEFINQYTLYNTSKYSLLGQYSGRAYKDINPLLKEKGILGLEQRLYEETNKLKTYEGTVYRGARDRNMQVGEVLTQEYLTSSSKEIMEASNFLNYEDKNVLYIIQSKTGKVLDDTHHEEFEVVFRPGTQFNVVKEESEFKYKHSYYDVDDYGILREFTDNVTYEGRVLYLEEIDQQRQSPAQDFLYSLGITEKTYANSSLDSPSHIAFDSGEVFGPLLPVKPKKKEKTSFTYEPIVASDAYGDKTISYVTEIGGKKIGFKAVTFNNEDGLRSAIVDFEVDGSFNFEDGLSRGDKIKAARWIKGAYNDFQQNYQPEFVLANVYDDDMMGDQRAKNYKKMGFDVTGRGATRMAKKYYTYDTPPASSDIQVPDNSAIDLAVNHKSTLNQSNKVEEVNHKPILSQEIDSSKPKTDSTSDKVKSQLEWVKGAEVEDPNSPGKALTTVTDSRGVERSVIRKSIPTVEGKNNILVPGQMYSIQIGNDNYIVEVLSTDVNATESTDFVIRSSPDSNVDIDILIPNSKLDSYDKSGKITKIDDTQQYNAIDQKNKEKFSKRKKVKTGGFEKAARVVTSSDLVDPILDLVKVAKTIGNNIDINASDKSKAFAKRVGKSMNTINKKMINIQDRSEEKLKVLQEKAKKFAETQAKYGKLSRTTMNLAQERQQLSEMVFAIREEIGLEVTELYDQVEYFKEYLDANPDILPPHELSELRAAVDRVEQGVINTLHKAGIELLDAVEIGNKVDYSTTQVVDTEESSLPRGSITQVVRRGFTVKNRGQSKKGGGGVKILRSTEVITSKPVAPTVSDIVSPPTNGLNTSPPKTPEPSSRKIEDVKVENSQRKRSVRNIKSAADIVNQEWDDRFIGTELRDRRIATSRNQQDPYQVLDNNLDEFYRRQRAAIAFGINEELFNRFSDMKKDAIKFRRQLDQFSTSSVDMDTKRKTYDELKQQLMQRRNDAYERAAIDTEKGTSLTSRSKSTLIPTQKASLQDSYIFHAEAMNYDAMLAELLVLGNQAGLEQLSTEHTNYLNVKGQVFSGVEFLLNTYEAEGGNKTFSHLGEMSSGIQDHREFFYGKGMDPNSKSVNNHMKNMKQLVKTTSKLGLGNDATEVKADYAISQIDEAIRSYEQKLEDMKNFSAEREVHQKNKSAAGQAEMDEKTNRKVESAMQEYNNNHRSMIEYLKQQKQKLKTGLDNGTLEDQQFRNVFEDIDVQSALLDRSNLELAEVFRPPTPGGTDPRLHTYRAMQGIQALNRVSQTLTQIRRELDPTAEATMQYSTERGQTATLMASIGIVTFGGGDWDGDSYTTIFHQRTELQAEIEKHRGNIKRYELIAQQQRKAIKNYEDELGKLDPNVGSEALQREQLMKKIEDIEDSIINSTEKKIQKSREKLDVALTDFERQVNDGKNNLNARVRKQVANYLGMDEAVFVNRGEVMMDAYGRQMKDDKGNVMYGRSNQATYDADAMFGIMDFAYGLVEGIDSKGNQMMTMMKNIDLLTGYRSDKNFDFFDQLMGEVERHPLDTRTESSEHPAIRLMKDRVAKLREKTGNYTKEQQEFLRMMGDADDKTYMAYLEQFHTMNENFKSQEANAALHTDLEAANLPKEIRRRKHANMFIGEWIGTMQGHDVLGKFMQQGVGMSITEGTFDMALKVLGKAGGEVLGKTYNTIISSTFQDSPVISYGRQILDEESDLNVAVRKEFAKRASENPNNHGSVIDESELDQRIKNSLAETHPDLRANSSDPRERERYSRIYDARRQRLTDENYANYMEVTQAAVTKSEGVQGFMKNIHQILRDSIKLKTDQADFLDKFEAMSKNYDEYSTKIAEAEGQENYNEREVKEWKDARDGIISDMASELGPGPGLKSLMNLDYLTNNATDTSMDKTEFEKRFFGNIANDHQRFMDTVHSMGDIITEQERSMLSDPSSLEDNSAAYLKVARNINTRNITNLVVSYRMERVISGKADGSADRSNIAKDFANSQKTRIATNLDMYRSGITPTNRTVENRIATADENAAADEFIRRRYTQIEMTGEVNKFDANRQHREALASHLGMKIDELYDDDGNIKQDDFTRRIKSASDSASLTMEEYLYNFDQLHEQAVGQVGEMFGKEGQKMEQFNVMNLMRKNMSTSMGDGKAPGYNGQNILMENIGTEVMTTMAQLGAQQKLGSLGTDIFASMYRGALSYLIDASDAVVKFDVVDADGNETGRQHELNISEMTPKQKQAYMNRIIFQHLLSGQTPNVDEEHGFNRNTSDKASEWKDFNNIIIGGSSMQIDEEGNIYDPLMEAFDKAGEATLSDSGREMMEARGEQILMQALNSEEETLNIVKQHLPGPDFDDTNKREAYAEQVSKKVRTQVVARQRRMARMRKEAQQRYMGNQSTANRGALVNKLDKDLIGELATNRGANLLDIMTPLFLTAMGSGIAEGNIDANQIQGLAGAAFTSFQYARAGFVDENSLDPAGNKKRLASAQMLSGVFKFKNALSQHGDENIHKAVAQMAVQETVSTAFNMVATPWLSQQFVKGMGANAAPAMNAISGNKYAASQQFAGNAAASIVSAISSTLISGVLMKTSNSLQQGLSDTIASFSATASAVSNVNEAIARRRAQQAAYEDLAAETDDSGAEVQTYMVLTEATYDANDYASIADLQEAQEIDPTNDGSLGVDVLA